jgi:predicted Zn finger-like uncharacterized protein
MNVTCPNCATVYRVDPGKVPDGGVRARCSICSAVFAVRREGEPQERTVPVTATAAAPAPQTAPAPSTAPQAPAAPRAEPVRPPAPPAAPPPAPPSPPPVAAPRPVSYPPPAVPAATPRPAPPAMSPPAAPPAPARPAAAATPVPPAPPASPGPTRPAAATGSRPVNPFLSQDPALKARRLARALISDMVVYHPGKRQEGLRDGNLKELFEDEIKKSWEEYADQVGKDVAGSTPYFKEALNEILAGGRQIF